MIIPEKQRVKIKKPVFIEGLPGLGNVGKIAIELLIEQTKAKRIVSFPVEPRPGVVLVQQNNMVRFPEMSLYHLKHKGKDFLFLVGDGQPTSEGAAYKLGESILSLLEELKCTELLTIGGIGLQQVPQEPAVYVTGNNKELMTRFKKLGANAKIHGVVGPIIGLTGILLGITKGRVPAAALLAESLAHPMYLGLRGAEQVLKLLAKAYGFKLDMQELEESIKALEDASRAPAGEMPKRPEEASYIG